jgi:dihydroorotate dehydrogenase
VSEHGFEFAGAQLEWPIGSAAGMTNHPTIEGVAARFDTLTASGLSVVTIGSWKLGGETGGNGYAQTDAGWEHVNVDEYLDLQNGAGYNAKGLPGPGADNGMPALPDLLVLARSRGVEMGLSFSPHTSDPLSEMPEILEHSRRALREGVLYVEINLSCPNVPGRPPFYQDADGLEHFYDMVASGPALLNYHGRPGLYPKYGPRTEGEYVFQERDKSLGGLVTSNTLGNQEPKDAEGNPAIHVNGGRAGMSGPALNWLGEEQLALALDHEPSSHEIVSALGVSTGADVYRRHDEMGAKLVQLGSVLYWPEQVGCETPAEVVQQIKEEYVAAAAA